MPMKHLDSEVVYHMFAERALWFALHLEQYVTCSAKP